MNKTSIKKFCKSLWMAVALVGLMPVTAHAEEYEQSEWWSYPVSVTGKVSYVTKTNVNEKVDMCLRVPDSLLYSVIDSVTVYIKDPASVANVQVWSTTSETLFDKSYAHTQQLPNVAEGENKVALDSPIEVKDAAVYVGLSFDALGTLYLPRYTKKNSGAFYLRADSLTAGEWYDYSSTYGNLAIRLHVKKPVLKDNHVKSVSLSEIKAKGGEQANTNLLVRNMGKNTITSLEYLVKYKGAEMLRNTVTLSLNKGSYGTIPVSLQVPDETGLISMTVEVAKVNGQANAVEEVPAVGNVLVVGEPMEKKVVVEEYTGMWCGYCPRGAVGMENLKKLYGDKFVGIAIHYGDTLQTTDFIDLVRKVSGFPAATFDRVITDVDIYNGYQQTSPWYFQGDQIFNTAMAIPAEGKVVLKASWSDEQKTSIDASVETTFSYSREDSPYTIAFVLTEDGMHGDSEEWLQSNYYSGGGAVYPGIDMKEFTTADAKVQMDYQMVGVQAWNVGNGIKGSVAPFKYMEPQTFAQTLDVSANELIQNKENLKLAALLINTATGAIINADQVSIANASTGIAGVTDNEKTEVVAYYTLNGMRVSSPVKGMNILKLANGKSVKVMKK